MFELIISSIRLLWIALKNRTGIVRDITIVTTLEIVSIVCLYKLNAVYGDLYGAIQLHAAPKIWRAIWTFSAIAGGLVVINGYLGAFVNRLAFLIREGLTAHCLSNLCGYGMENLIGQKIQEDLRKFSESSCEFWTALFKAVIKIPVFLGVVISLTTKQTGLVILVVVVIGTILTRIVSKTLVPLQVEQESNEALFRSQITNLGEPRKVFLKIREQFYKINKQLKILSFTQSGLSQAFVLLPFIVLMPLYIATTITMGQFFQSVNALSKIIDSLTILIDSRQIIVAIESSLNRLQFITTSEEML